MVSFPNATLTLSRKAGTTTSTIAGGLTARVQSIGAPKTESDRPAAGFRYRVYLDTGVDVRLHDTLTGYNPRSITPAPELIVEDVALRDGPLPHLEVNVIDRRSRES